MFFSVEGSGLFVFLFLSLVQLLCLQWFYMGLHFAPPLKMSSTDSLRWPQSNSEPLADQW